MPSGYGSHITIFGDLDEALNVSPNIPQRTKRASVPWDADKYERVILHNLNQLARSRVGGAVLRGIRRPLTIRPYAWTPENAVTIPANALGSTAAGSPVTCKDANNSPRGTGTGSDVTIWITPKSRRYPDTTLVHELMHAIRQMSGERTCTPYGSEFGREEEYFAILVANIYQSEQRRGFIKLNHKSSSWLDTKRPWDEFRIDPFLITQFGMRHPSLSMDIGRSPAAFNPFSPRHADKVRVANH